MPPPPRLAILHEEIEHEAWFSEFLGHGPSGHYSREGRPNSPYVVKFLNAGQPDEHPERVGSPNRPINENETTSFSERKRCLPVT
jgi:hypothetical protein